MPDIIIKNGTVVDGTGSPGFRADVAVTGDRIEAVGGVEAGDNGCSVIDAEGKIVCPGIIDAHSHADLTVFRANHAEILEPLVRQGITTFVGGNCGMSMAPIGRKKFEPARDYIEAFTAMDIEKEINWRTTAEFFDEIESRDMLMNSAILAPHGLIRIHEMGLDARYAEEEEVRGMKKLVEECMEAGCIGLSTGLQYFPGSQSDTRELVALGESVAKYGGIFTSHLRSYSNTLPQAIDEIVEVAKQNDIPAQVSHIFWVPDSGRLGRPLRAVVRALARLADYWVPPVPLDGEVGKQLGKLDGLREQGINIGMDVMPTTTGFTHLLAFFPPWALTGDKEQIMSRIEDTEMRRRMLRDITTGRMIWPHVEGNTWSLNLFKIMGWECVRIMSVVSEKNKRYEGMHLPVIAKERGQHPFDAACDLLLEEDGRVLIFESLARPEDNFTERSMFAALKHPEVSVSTDTILMGFGRPSYLFYGCYPKFLSRYVRDKKMLGLETGIRKLSGLPAEHFKLKDRGFVREGCFADLLVLDMEKIDPNCSFVDPVGRPSGIEHVFINGGHVLKDGEIDGSVQAGRLLRRE